MNDSPEPPSEDGEERPPRFQYSLRTLMIVVTVCAVVASLTTTLGTWVLWLSIIFVIGWFGTGRPWERDLPRYERKSWPALIGSYYGEHHKNTSIGISRHKGKFRTEITTDRRTFPLYEGTLPIPWDTWFHVALVYDGATLTEYLNGVKGASIEASGNMATPTELFLGRDHTEYDAITGTLDEVMIFGAALTEEQVKMLFNTQGGR